MDLFPFFKSVLEEDHCAIVLCDTQHQIVYMNPAACERYHRYGGAALIGQNLLCCHHEHSCEQIREVVQWFKKDKTHNRVYTYRNEKENKDVYMVALRDETGALIGYYEKHEYRTKEIAPLYQLD